MAVWNMKIVKKFLFSISSIMRTDNLMMERLSKNKLNAVLESYGDLRIILTNILKECIEEFNKEELVELLTTKEQEY